MFRKGPYRWLTVASPEEPDGTELHFERNDNASAKAYQQPLFQQKQLAAEFQMPPTQVTGSIIAQANDTCGNLIQITQLLRHESG